MTNTHSDVGTNPASPEWKVFFHGNFWGHHGKDHAGREIKIGKAFDWAGYRWLIPAAYSCGRGLVMDFCMRVEAGDIRAFMEKWGLTWENDFRGRTREQQMEMELDNPLCLHFRPELEVNGKKLVPDRGCAVTFNPCPLCHCEERSDVAIRIPLRWFYFIRSPLQRSHSVYVTEKYGLPRRSFLAPRNDSIAGTLHHSTNHTKPVT